MKIDWFYFYISAIVICVWIALFLCCTSCVDTPAEHKINMDKTLTREVVEEDSCEYILEYSATTNYGGDYLYSRIKYHKGNCKYCQARLEKTLKKMIENDTTRTKEKGR